MGLIGPADWSHIGRVRDIQSVSVDTGWVALGLGRGWLERSRPTRDGDGRRVRALTYPVTLLAGAMVGALSPPARTWERPHRACPCRARAARRPSWRPRMARAFGMHNARTRTAHVRTSARLAANVAVRPGRALGRTRPYLGQGRTRPHSAALGRTRPYVRPGRARSEGTGELSARPLCVHVEGGPALSKGKLKTHCRSPLQSFDRLLSHPLDVDDRPPRFVRQSFLRRGQHGPKSSRRARSWS
jgi:hypothetical protein